MDALFWYTGLLCWIIVFCAVTFSFLKKLWFAIGASIFALKILIYDRKYPYGNPIPIRDILSFAATETIEPNWIARHIETQHLIYWPWPWLSKDKRKELDREYINSMNY